MPTVEPEVPANRGGSPATWVRLSYDAGIETLKAQRDELNGMRTRAVAFGALTIAACAFLVGQGLAGATRSLAFFVFAGLGTAVFIGLALLLVAIVAPALKFRFILEPDKLMAFVQEGNSSRTEEMALRRLAMHVVPEMIATNENSLKAVRSRYRWLLGCAVGTIATWVALVWVFA